MSLLLRNLSPTSSPASRSCINYCDLLTGPLRARPESGQHRAAPAGPPSAAAAGDPGAVTQAQFCFVGSPDGHHLQEPAAELLLLLSGVGTAHQEPSGSWRWTQPHLQKVPPALFLKQAGVSERQQGLTAALSSDNLPSTCLLHSGHFVTRALPAQVISLACRWHARQSGAVLNAGYPQGPSSCFVRPGWSNKGSSKSALKNPSLLILHLL